MGIDLTEAHLLFSVGTYLAYRIERDYYKGVHYVWCTTEFNSKKQPVTSRPLTICRRYLEQITGADRHTSEISNNQLGILTGAKLKYDLGIINEKQYNEIKQIVACSSYESFYPVLYIIYTDKVKDRCIEVPKIDCASDNSIEIKIMELQEDEFSLINFRDILFGITDVIDKKAGE